MPKSPEFFNDQFENARPSIPTKSPRKRDVPDIPNPVTIPPIPVEIPANPQKVPIKIPTPV